LEVSLRKKEFSERKEPLQMDKMSEKAIEIIDGDKSLQSAELEEPYWIKDLLLYDSDKRVLESPTAWINGSIIDASQKLLVLKFKHCKGLQSVACGYSMTFCIQRREFVQILYDEVQHHWLAIASVSIGKDEPVVNVYDSMFHTASSHVKKQIACIINSAYRRSF